MLIVDAAAWPFLMLASVDRLRDADRAPTHITLSAVSYGVSTTRLMATPDPGTQHRCLSAAQPACRIGRCAMSDASNAIDGDGPAPGSPDLTGPIAFAARLGGGLGEFNPPIRLQWQRGRLDIRSARWPWAVSALVVMALLAGFLWVVRGGVEQGQSRRNVTAQRAEAYWRCRTEPVRQLRDACDARLSAEAVAALAP
jgi:hypothetical protein